MKDPTHFQGRLLQNQQKYIDKIKKISSPEPLSQFQPNLAQSMHPWVRIQICSNEGPRPFPRGDNYEIVKYIYEIKKSSSPETLANFNQTWCYEIHFFTISIKLHAHVVDHSQRLYCTIQSLHASIHKYGNVNQTYVIGC